MESIKVIAGVERRRRYSLQEKLALVAETEQPGMTVSLIARRNGLSQSLLFRWKKLMKGGAASAIHSGQPVIIANEVKALQHKVRELERLLGRKTMAAEILKEAMELAKEKKWLLHMPLLKPDINE